MLRAIEQQVLRPGMSLPSVRELARQYEISTFTVASAYSRLVSLGWLAARRSGLPRRFAGRARAPGRDAVLGAAAPERRLAGVGHLRGPFHPHQVRLWLAAGEWLNEEGLHVALRHLGRVPAMRIANYGHPYGYAPLRETIAASLSAQGMEVEVSQVLLTQGVSHGLDMVIRTLLRHGDTVVVEQPAYANLLQMLRLAGLRVVPVPRNADGLDCEALERVAAQHRPRALFINTALQNPSGASIGMANAFRILQTAERHGLWVVEDDISRELAPGVTPMLAALDGGCRVVYLGGYSKVISPSVRVGYVVAHRDAVRDIARTKMAVGLTSPEIMERIVHQVIREGRYRAHIARTRERLEQAHAAVAGLMDAHGFDIHTRPQAGLFLWAKVAGQWRGRGANRLAEMALKDGIWLAPGSYFEADEADTPWVRFNVAYSEAPALWRFMRNAGAA